MYFRTHVAPWLGSKFLCGGDGRQRRWHVISWPDPWLSSGLRGQRPRTSKFRCVVVALTFCADDQPSCTCQAALLSERHEKTFSDAVDTKYATKLKYSSRCWYVEGWPLTTNRQMKIGTSATKTWGIWDLDPGFPHPEVPVPAPGGCTGPSNDEPGLPRSTASLQKPCKAPYTLQYADWLIRFQFKKYILEDSHHPFFLKEKDLNRTSMIMFHDVPC